MTRACATKPKKRTSKNVHIHASPLQPDLAPHVGSVHRVHQVVSERRNSSHT